MTTHDVAAGRELDALVAEKVLGWQRDAPDSIWWHVGERLIEAPPFSTDISAAWRVLDEMVWRVGTANIRLDMEDYGRGGGTSPNGAERAVWVTIGEYTAFGPAPLAICQAALMAIVEA